jgi:hypothetical protein
MRVKRNAATVALLKGAMDRVSTPRKWCKGGNDKYDAKGRTIGHCANGATFAECNARVYKEGPVTQLKWWDARSNANDALNVVVRKGKKYHVSIIGFNDAPETKHADVMAVFRKAIKLVRPIKRKA